MHYVNRELSALDFIRRVLAIAEDGELPILERAKFLAITASSLDEFFQVRVAGLKAQIAARVATRTPDGRTPMETLTEVHETVGDLYVAMSRTFHHDLVPGLEKEGITFSDWSSLDTDDRHWLDEQFAERIFPVLTPLAVDPAES